MLDHVPVLVSLPLTRSVVEDVVLEVVALEAVDKNNPLFGIFLY